MLNQKYFCYNFRKDIVQFLNPYIHAILIVKRLRLKELTRPHHLLKLRLPDK